jgi:hypothetical protein
MGTVAGPSVTWGLCFSFDSYGNVHYYTGNVTGDGIV